MGGNLCKEIFFCGKRFELNNSNFDDFNYGEIINETLRNEIDYLTVDIELHKKEKIELQKKFNEMNFLFNDLKRKMDLIDEKKKLDKEYINIYNGNTLIEYSNDENNDIISPRSI